MNARDQSVLDRLEKQFTHAPFDGTTGNVGRPFMRDGGGTDVESARRLLRPQSRWGPLFGLTAGDLDAASRALAGHPTLAPWQRTVKRSLDLITSAAALMLILPLVVVLIALIRSDSPGPVFFRSPRVGRDGKVFGMLKFRTMYTNAEARLRDLELTNGDVLFKVVPDPRVTRVGRVLRRYSLDELPQFFNVLLGDMSIVGPRPPLPSESDFRPVDLPVRPGITGIWQLTAPTMTATKDLDLLEREYVESWSVPKDLRIVWSTVRVLVSPTGY